MLKEINVNINIVSTNNFKTVFSRSKLESNITQSPLIKDYTTSSETFLPA
jgi:hypothetical protein